MMTSTGLCELCHGIFGKAAMAKHLKSCRQSKAGGGFHLLVEGRRQREYWMHLEAPPDANLDELDQFLRDIWLECCGHLSSFTIHDRRYVSQRFDDFEDDRSMDVPLRKVLQPGMRFYHEYDFGTPTHLALRVMAAPAAASKKESIRLLARNVAPSIVCDQCGKAATQVCTQCEWSGGGWLCEECAGKHKCGGDMFLSVVNSPRVGLCGYCG